MSIKILEYHKNIGNFISEEVNKHNYHIIFLDWDDTVISTESLKHYKFMFRNEYERFRIIEKFKEEYNNKYCLGLYILTYRQNIFDVQGEAVELGIAEFLKTDSYKIKRTNKYNRAGPVICVDIDCPKITVLEEIVNSDKKISNNVTIYFVDDNLQNIMTSFFTSKFHDNLLLYFYPFSETDKNLTNRLEDTKNKLLKYLKK